MTDIWSESGYYVHRKTHRWYTFNVTYDKPHYLWQKIMYKSQIKIIILVFPKCSVAKTTTPCNPDLIIDCCIEYSVLPLQKLPTYLHIMLREHTITQEIICCFIFSWQTDHLSFPQQDQLSLVHKWYETIHENKDNHCID